MKSIITFIFKKISSKTEFPHIYLIAKKVYSIKILNTILRPLVIKLSNNQRREPILELYRKNLCDTSSDPSEVLDKRVFSEYVIAHESDSKSQLFQDLLVLWVLKNKKFGFFVEFGATNGIDLSNTWILEKKYSWAGILAEPAKQWHHELRSNRNCQIDTDCVYSSSGQELTFLECAELSTINACAKEDAHLRQGISYPVKTVSLVDLLQRYNSPQEIDYLSIDTEGSEFTILESFDWSQYRFNVITVEHNFTENRNKIMNLLKSHGYINLFSSLSNVDDWYIHPSILKNHEPIPKEM